MVNSVISIKRGDKNINGSKVVQTVKNKNNDNKLNLVVNCRPTDEKNSLLNDSELSLYQMKSFEQLGIMYFTSFLVIRSISYCYSYCYLRS